MTTRSLSHNGVDTRSTKTGPGPVGMVTARTRTADAPTDGYLSHRFGAEIEDREWRSTHPGQHLRSAYLTIVGDNPDLAPGDRRSAREQLSRVEAAIAQGGWTRAEWRRLYAMRRKWRIRVEGRDSRFEIVGNRRGSLTEAERRSIELHRLIKQLEAKSCYE